MQVAMEDVRTQLTHCLDQPPEKASQIPAVTLSDTNGRNSSRTKFGFERPWVKVDDTDIKPAIGGQSLCQGDHLTLRPAMTEVTDEKGEAGAAFHRQDPTL